MDRRAFRRAGRDLGVGLGGFLLILSVAYALGRVFVPSFPSALGEIEFPDPDSGGPDPGTTPFDPAAALADLHAAFDEAGFTSSALLEARGVLEGRYAFGIPDYREWMDAGVPDGPALDVSIRYIAGVSLGTGSTTDEATLAIGARGLEVGAPRTEAVSVTFATERLLFAAKAGQCEIELLDLAYVMLPPWSGSEHAPDVNMPRFAGQVACADLTEVRSGELLSFVVVFDYDPEQFGF